MFKKGTFQHVGISNSEAAVLAGYANLGLAKNTHDTYHSAEACLRRCEADTGELLNLPWGSRETYKFFLYMESKNFTAETMRTYMAGIRNLHIRNNYKDISLHSPLMSLILKGNLLHFFPVAFCRSAVVCVLRGRYGMTSERRNDIQNDLNDSRMQKVVLVSFDGHSRKQNVVSLSFLVIPGMTFFGRMTLKRFLAIVLVSFFFFSLILPPD